MKIAPETISTINRHAWRFLNVGKAHGEILRLEALLGIERQGTIYNIRKANARVLELEGMLSKRGATPAPTRQASLKATPATPAPALTGLDRTARAIVIDGTPVAQFDHHNARENNVLPKTELTGLAKMASATRIKS